RLTRSAWRARAERRRAIASTNSPCSASSRLRASMRRWRPAISPAFSRSRWATRVSASWWRRRCTSTMRRRRWLRSVIGLARCQPGGEGRSEIFDELPHGDDDEKKAAGEDEGHRDEEYRDLRRQLVGDADREVDDDRIDDERAADAEGDEKGGGDLVDDVDQRQPRAEAESGRYGRIGVDQAANQLLVETGDEHDRGRGEREERGQRRNVLFVLVDGAGDRTEADRLGDGDGDRLERQKIEPGDEADHQANRELGENEAEHGESAAVAQRRADRVDEERGQRQR